MDQNTNGTVKRGFSLDNAPFWALTILLVLIPTFFIPSVFINIIFSKALLVSIGTIIALVFYLIVLIKKGDFVFTKTPIIFALGALSLVYLVSGFFSHSSTGSFLGYSFESGTFISVLILSLLTYMVSTVFQSPNKLFWANGAFLIVAGISAVLQTVFIFFGVDFLPQGVFASLIVNTVGKTNELAIFFGISAVLSLIALEILKLAKIYRIILYVVLVLSMFVMTVLNFSTIWYVFGAVAFLFFVYQMTSLGSSAGRMVVADAGSEGQGTRLQPNKRKIATRTLVVAIIAVFFVLPIGHDLAQGLANKLGVANFEVRPSWGATYEVFKGSIKSSPILGAGPNRFFTEWQLNRPDINQSDYWNYGFNSGIGFVPTAFVETGILGALAWIFFILSILYVCYRALTHWSNDPLVRFFVVSSSAITLFLWAVNIFYQPGSAILGLSFFFTGLLVASAALAGVQKVSSTEFLNRPKISLVVISGLVCILMASLWLAYIMFERGRSSIYYQMGTSVINNEGNIEKGEPLIFKALSLTENDIYYRTVTEINLIRMNRLVSAVSAKSEASEAEKIEFQNALTSAVESARLATQYDPGNYENWLMAARVYETILPVGFEGAYEQSKAGYAEALKFSPRNPAIFLGLARLEVAKKDLPAAEANIVKALELKWNYLDAIFLQSQIDIAKGNIVSAIKLVEQIAAISPTDPTNYFRLGILKYEHKDYRGAVAAFEKSISLVPVYANAKYFLGLSYEKVNKIPEAIKQFEELRLENPENQEVKTILANLKAGRDPFAGAASEADSSPENRKELPVDEE